MQNLLTGSGNTLCSPKNPINLATQSSSAKLDKTQSPGLGLEVDEAVRIISGTVGARNHRRFSWEWRASCRCDRVAKLTKLSVWFDF